MKKHSPTWNKRADMQQQHADMETVCGEMEHPVFMRRL